MRRTLILLAIATLCGCAEPGEVWEVAAPDAKVKDSLEAIVIAQDICRSEIQSLTGRNRQDFFEHQTRYGWRATLSKGVWRAGVRGAIGGPECFDVGAQIDARTGKAAGCFQCVTVG